MRRLKSAATVLLSLLMMAWAAAPDAAAAESYSQDAVKAAYLYRFTDYIGWPAAQQPGDRFDIAVVGDPGVARELRRLLSNHTVKNQPAQVREISREAELGAPQMLYIGAGHGDFLRHVMAEQPGRPILVVTDENGGLEYGGVVNFLTVDHRVRFEVSLTAAGRSNLSISSELLSVAARVDGDRQRGHAS